MGSNPRPDSGVIMDFTDDGSTRWDTNTPDTGVGSSTKLEDSSGKVTSTNQISAILPHTNSESHILASREEEKGESEALSFAEVAEWALNSQRQHQQDNLTKLRSLSLQLSRKPSINTAEPTRRQSSYMAKDNPDTGSRPTSAMLESRIRSQQSYANPEGVQLRGDKGKARRKSATSQSSRANSGITPMVSNEWKRSFVVPYSPRKKVTKIVRGSIEPLKIGLLDRDRDVDDKDISQSKVVASSSSKSSLHHTVHQRPPYNLRSGKCNFQNNKDRFRRIEIHYEDYLPTDQWLEMKPKKFARNHKHGNHFESSRKAEEKNDTKSLTADVARKEAFVWENPYQIWLMEKTHRE